MTDLPGYDVRYTSPKDAEYLLKWLTEDIHWFPMSIGKEVEDSVKNWIGFAKFKCSLTATLNDVPCGIVTLFLMPYRKVSHHSMFYIIVDREHRRKGIGTSLMKNILNLSRNYFNLESIHCEIFEGCSLLNILEKQHFIEFARQKKYVKDGNQYLDRILLEHFFGIIS